MREQPHDVLDFWLGDGLSLGWPSDDRGSLWFGGGPGLDDTVRQRFGEAVEKALGGGLTDWEQTISDRLALIILLDQFTRNVYRGSARAFAGDGRSQRLVMQGLALELDKELPVIGRVFFYMPLMHSENLADQERCVRLLCQRMPESGKANLLHARAHREVIRLFGRFPFRNDALRRSTTDPEEAFVSSGGYGATVRKLQATA